MCSENDYLFDSKKSKSVSVTVILTVANSEKLKSATIIQQLIVRKDFWNYEAGIGNPSLISRKLKSVTGRQTVIP